MYVQKSFRERPIQLPLEIVDVNLKDINFCPGERHQKICPIQIGNYSSLFLRDLPSLVPVHRSSQAHFVNKLVRCLSQSRQNLGGNVE